MDKTKAILFLVLLPLGVLHFGHRSLGQSLPPTVAVHQQLIQKILDDGQSMESRMEAARTLVQSADGLAAARPIFIDILLAPNKYNLGFRQAIAFTLSRFGPADFSDKELTVLGNLVTNGKANGDVRVTLFPIFLKNDTAFTDHVVLTALSADQDKRTKGKLLEAIRYKTVASAAVRQTIRAIVLDTSEDPEIRHQAAIFFRFAQNLQPGELDRWEALARNKGEQTKIRSVALQVLQAQHYNPPRLSLLLTSLITQAQEAPDVRATAIDLAGATETREDFKPLLLNISLDLKELPGIRVAAIGALEKLTSPSASKIIELRNLVASSREEARVRFAALKFIVNQTLPSSTEKENYLHEVLLQRPADSELQKSILYYIRDQRIVLNSKHLTSVSAIAINPNVPIDLRLASLAAIKVTGGDAVSEVERLVGILNKQDIFEFGHRDERELYQTTIDTVIEIGNRSARESPDTTVAVFEKASQLLRETLGNTSSPEIRAFDTNIQAIISASKSQKRTSIQEFGARIVEEHPVPSLVAFLILGWLVVIFLVPFVKPAIVLRLHSAIRRLNKKIAWLEKHDIVGAMLLVNWVVSWEPVLNSWVESKLDRARVNFEALDSVHKRTPWIQVNVEWEGRNLSPTASWIRAPITSGTGPLLIYGQGGVGKTSLAFQIARWALGLSADVPIPAMIPVLIEGTVDYASGTGGNGFLNFVSGKLRMITGETGSLDTGLVADLLEKRKILLIVDGYSEMPEESRKRVLLFDNQLPINALIVTTRDDEFRTEPRRIVKAPPLEKAAVADFIENYLKFDSKDKLFNNQEFQLICAKIAHVVGTRSITPLIAKLYANHCVRAKNEGRDVSVVSIPGLFEDYLHDALQRYSREDGIEYEAVIPFIKELAWACTKEQYRASTIRRSAIAALPAAIRLGDTAAVNRHLEFLSRQASILASHESEGGISFQLDPAAEYFAALWLVDRHRAGSQDLRDALVSVERKLSEEDRIGDFAIAMIDCIRVHLSDEHDLLRKSKELETAALARRAP